MLTMSIRREMPETAPRNVITTIVIHITFLINIERLNQPKNNIIKSKFNYILKVLLVILLIDIKTDKAEMINTPLKTSTVIKARPRATMGAQAAINHRQNFQQSHGINHLCRINRYN
jgi:hypothetical protein